MDNLDNINMTRIERSLNSTIKIHFDKLISEAKQTLLSMASNRPLSDWKPYHSLKAKVNLYDRRKKLSKIK